MRFEVPQFIEVEDKIFGPLTWRQFIYLGGGVGWAVVSFLFFPFIIFVILGLPVLILSLALSFYPVNSRPFSVFLESVFNYISGHKLYLWKQASDVVYKKSDDVAVVTSSNIAIKKPGKGRDVSSLARKLELQAMQKPQ